MPAGFRRHLVGKTLVNVFHCDVAENTLCWQASDHTDIFINQRIECYLNNTINLRPLTPHIMPCYTHKMAIVSWPQILWRHFTLCRQWVQWRHGNLCSRYARHIVGTCRLAGLEGVGFMVPLFLAHHIVDSRCFNNVVWQLVPCSHDYSWQKVGYIGLMT